MADGGPVRHSFSKGGCLIGAARSRLQVASKPAIIRYAAQGNDREAGTLCAPLRLHNDEHERLVLWQKTNTVITTNLFFALKLGPVNWKACQKLVSLAPPARALAEGRLPLAP